MSSQDQDDDRGLARCPFCGQEQEKIAAQASDDDFRFQEPPEGMRACKCQNSECGRVFFTSDE